MGPVHGNSWEDDVQTGGYSPGHKSDYDKGANGKRGTTNYYYNDPPLQAPDCQPTQLVLDAAYAASGKGTAI